MNAQEQMDNLRAAGFSSDEVDNWAAGKKQELTAAGFNNAEIDDYFGKKEFTGDASLQKHFDQTIGDAAKAHVNGDGTPKEFTFGDALKAGWQMSTTSLMKRGKMPDVVMPEDAPWYDRAAYGVAQTVGDIPAGVAGFLIGGGAGSETGPGALVTGTGGAFALPTALRATMVDAYTKGEFKTPGEFLQRASGIMIDSAKAWVTGAATAATGGAVDAALPVAETTIGSVTRAAAVQSSQIATMATTSKAMEGHLPSWQDFLDAAIVMGVVGGTTKVATKLGEIYKQTGLHPAEVLQDAQVDPTVKQDVLSENVAVPKAYESMIDPAFKQEAPKPEQPSAPEAPAKGTPEAAQANILAKVQVGGESPKEKLTWDNLYTKVIDDLNPIKKSVEAMTNGEKLPASEDPYILARLTRGAYGKADQFLMHSPFDYKTFENVGTSLKDVLEPVKDDLDGLRAFAIAKRAQELEARGIKSGFNINDANAVVSAGEAKYGDVVKGLYDYQNHLTKYLRDSGVISSDTYDAMLQANKNYVPFYRVMDENNITGAVGKGLQARDPIKSIKGSDKAVIDPIESIIKNTYVYTALADRNAVGQKFVELANKSAAPEQFIEKVKPTIRGTTASDTEMTKFLKSQGIDEVPDDLLTIFRAFKQPVGENEIAVFEDGKRTVYQVKPDVAAAFKAADNETAGWLFKLLSVPTKLARAGITLSPDFFPRNIARDQFDAYINSKNGFVPILDTVRGAASLVAKDEDYQNWLKSGGANSTLVSMDRRYIQEHVFKLDQETGLTDKVWNIIKSPVEALRVVSELAENSTRLGEFKKAVGENPDKADIQSAGFESREVTLDFARMGAKTRAVNQLIAFWNAQVQGVDRIARRFQEDPASAAAKVTASITLPSILLWYANKDDPRYKEIPDWQKDMFWIVMTKDHIYRIPKPHEAGLMFGSLVERFLDWTDTYNPQALKNFGNTLSQTFTPGVVPTFAQPVLEQWANKSLFTGGPIVPADTEKLLPEYQYTPYTTELAKGLGRLVGSVPYMHDSPAASPAIVENYIRQWSGGLGMYAVQLADAGLRKTGVLPDPVTPASTLADIPIIKAFVVRYPSGSAQSIQDFYKDYQQRRQVLDTVRYLAKNGDFASAVKEARMNPQAMIQLDGIKEALSKSQQFVKLVWKNPSMTANDKRQLIDATYYQMINMAQTGNQLIRSIDASMADTPAPPKN